MAYFESISVKGSTNWTSDSLTDASILLLAITTTDFLSAWVIVNKGLNYVLALARSLQAEAKDIVEAVTEVDNVKDVLTNVHENVDTFHGQWFVEVEKTCDSIGMQSSLPRLCGHQSHRFNVLLKIRLNNYRRSVTIPVLDHLLSEIHVKSRFSIHQKTALLGLYLIPSIAITKKFEEIVEKLSPLEKMYESDFKDSTFQNELHQWYLKWEKEKNLHGVYALPVSLPHTLHHVSSYYINIGVLLNFTGYFLLFEGYNVLQCA